MKQTGCFITLSSTPFVFSKHSYTSQVVLQLFQGSPCRLWWHSTVFGDSNFLHHLVIRVSGKCKVIKSKLARVKSESKSRLSRVESQVVQISSRIYLTLVWKCCFKCKVTESLELLGLYLSRFRQPIRLNNTDRYITYFAAPVAQIF